MKCPKENKECIHACDGTEYKDVNEPFCHLKAMTSGKPYIFSQGWTCPKNVPEEHQRGRLF
jgi:hypothetical protein